ncbi:hypothetical protein UACE39S_06801 [Ureibacillus acetophenoni]
MPKIVSVSTYEPPYNMKQSNLEQLTRELFKGKFKQLDRLLNVFENGDIQSRQFCVPVEWYKEDHILRNGTISILNSLQNIVLKLLISA